MNNENIKEIYSPVSGDRYYKINHSSGLTIFVYPKQGYSSTYAIFGTKYGSINNCFSVDGGEKITVPHGIAHYLEHKLFESEDGDAFTRYAKTGANANAYTSFDKTCYLFSCSEKLDENLEILLDFVQSPYFTEQTVLKEQGIIGQEIRMYDDNPQWRVMFNLLEAMYHNHPVKVDIAGTVESIAEITPKLLYDCYNAFYDLNNMALCVCGNATVEQVLSVADKTLKKTENRNVKSYFEQEPYEILKPYVEQEFPVSVELFNLGFKNKPKETACAMNDAVSDILLYLLASPTSSLYRKLMDSNLINQSFAYEYFDGPGFDSVIFSGESRSPKEAAEMIKQYINQTKQNGIEKEEFEIAKKAVYGDTIASLNSVDSIANEIIDCTFAGSELFEYIECLSKATVEDAERLLCEILDVNNCALSVIKAKS